jgi:hypothetical protein
MKINLFLREWNQSMTLECSQCANSTALAGFVAIAVATEPSAESEKCMM